jgi:hypothetical protein
MSYPLARIANRYTLVEQPEQLIFELCCLAPWPSMPMPTGNTLQATTLLFVEDPSHRLSMNVESGGHPTQTDIGLCTNDRYKQIAAHRFIIGERTNEAATDVYRGSVAPIVDASITGEVPYSRVEIRSHVGEYRTYRIHHS